MFFPLRLLAAAYTDFFRGVPLLIVLYLVGFGIPALMIFPRMPAMFWGTIALVISYSAYVAEVLRAGMEAVHPSQRVCRRSLPRAHARTNAAHRGHPAGRALVRPGAHERLRVHAEGRRPDLRAGRRGRGPRRAATGRGTFNFTPYIVAGLFFVILSWPMIRLTDIVTARLNRREQSGGAV